MNPTVRMQEISDCIAIDSQNGQTLFYCRAYAPRSSIYRTRYYYLGRCLLFNGKKTRNFVQFPMEREILIAIVTSSRVCFFLFLSVFFKASILYFLSVLIFNRDTRIFLRE